LPIKGRTIIALRFDARGRAKVAKGLCGHYAGFFELALKIPDEHGPAVQSWKQEKSAHDFSVKDAPAALPQNCQTTKWILKNYSFCVNVTLVIEIFQLVEESQNRETE
jgi:hypothetical protein